MQTPEHVSGEFKDVAKEGSRSLLKDRLQSLIKEVSYELEDLQDMKKTKILKKSLLDETAEKQKMLGNLQQMWVALDRSADLPEETRNQIKSYFESSLESRAQELQEASTEKKEVDPVLVSMYEQNQENIEKLRALTQEPRADKIKIEEMMRSLEGANMVNPYNEVLRKEEQARQGIAEAQKWVDVAEKL